MSICILYIILFFYFYYLILKKDNGPITAPHNKCLCILILFSINNIEILQFILIFYLL
jgi:hypothetical protein